jgi:uncharacterized membrane protein YqjE
MQEQANSSPGFQAFLEKKGDEHAFSCLYLIAGIVCLWAAFSHGNEFCTAPDSTASAAAAKFVPALTAVDTAAPHRALLATKFTATSTDRMAAMKSIAVKGHMLDEVGGAAGNEAAGASEISQLAPSAGSNSTDADSDSDAGLSMKTAMFIGPKGWVVTWLTVEGFTALGLPLVSIVMLLLRMHENACVSCLLYVVAVFQAIWLIGNWPALQPRPLNHALEPLPSNRSAHIATHDS